MEDQESAHEYFGAIAEEYSSLVERAMPSYQRMLSAVLEYNPTESQSVVDLGCGTGNLTVLLANSFPDARLTALDGSAKMLDLTETRLAPKSITKVVAQFEKTSFPKNSFDLVTSCLALHHIKAPERFFKRVSNWLRPGGTLIFGDQFRSAKPEHDRLNWKRLVQYWNEPGHLSEQEQGSLERHREKHDHYIDLDTLFQYLRSVGFCEIDCVWRDGMLGVVSAKVA